jgi:hypothetical protein
MDGMMLLPKGFNAKAFGGTHVRTSLATKHAAAVNTCRCG